MRWLGLVVMVLLLAGCTSNEPTPAGEPDPQVRQPRWDPRDVDDLAAAGPGVAPGLPARVAPPDRATPLAASPVDAAVLTVGRRGRRVQLLGVDGSWREVRPSERYGRESLSPDGVRLAFLLGDRIELWHLPTGERTELPLPSRFQPWDYSRIGWLDVSTLLLDDHAGGWRVDIASGAAERTPFPRRFSWTVDHDGVVLEATDPSRPPALLDWAGGTPRRIDLTQVGTPVQVDASPDLVAGTAYADGRFAVFTLDREDPDVVRTLPMRDFDGNYSNGALRTVQVLDDGSVLLWVAVPGRGEVDGWRLVRWVPETDRLQVVTTSEADPTWSLTFAADLLEGEPRREATTEARLDPRAVDELPAADADVAPLLPMVLEVPESSPALGDRPIGAAVLSIGGDDAVHLLSADGSWRSVPLPSVTGSVELTRDGTRLAIASESGVDVWHLATGTRTSLPFPPGHRPTDLVTWHWLDNRSLLLDGTWQVDARTGDALRVREPHGQFVVDDAGELYEFGWGSELTLLQVRGDTVAGVGWSDRADSRAVVVADRADLEPREVLLVRDDSEGTYGNGGLSVQALLADGTVLLRVLVDPGSRSSVRFIAWSPESGDLRLVTRTLSTLPAWSVASDLLG